MAWSGRSVDMNHSWIDGNIFQLHFYQNITISTDETEFENFVYKFLIILFRS